jgi:hypothetical protein
MDVLGVWSEELFTTFLLGLYPSDLCFIEYFSRHARYL